jgi:hypothetical protein
MTPKGRPHPSGRPIRIHLVKGRSIWRIPDTEPNVPRLRPQRQTVEAIGFIHNFHEAPDNDA